jgi:DNA-binding HxlR family transcriptional regulator
MLIETLRRLEAAGIVRRFDLTEKILHVEYHFNPLLRPEIVMFLDQLRAWAEVYERSQQAVTP